MALRPPAEHGAWGILLVAFVCSAAAAGVWNAPLALTGLCALALFLLRGSVEAQGGWPALLDPAHLALALLAALAGGITVFGYARYQLLLLAVPGAALYLLQQWIVRRHNEKRTEKRSLAAELVGVALLTLAAPAAWVGAHGVLEATGARVWLLNLLFFLGGVLYVKYRVRGLLVHRAFAGARERLRFAWPVFAYHVLLVVFLASLVLLDSLSAAALLAFAPAVLRAGRLAFELGQRFPIKRLGWSEVAHSVVFAMLLILSLRL
jgi:hypothetical protein